MEQLKSSHVILRGGGLLDKILHPDKSGIQNDKNAINSKIIEEK